MHASRGSVGAALEQLAASGPDPERVAGVLAALGGLILEGTVTGVEHGARRLEALLADYPRGSLDGRDFAEWCEAHLAAERTALATATADADSPTPETMGALLDRRDRLAALETGASLFDIECWAAADQLAAADERLAEWAERLADPHQDS